jgi:hypothetical protein
VHLEEERFAAPVFATDPRKDYWLWDYFVSGVAGLGDKAFTINTYGSAGVTENAAITINLQGGTDTAAEPDHHAVFVLNGAEIGEAIWEGTEANEAIITFSQELLNDGENILEITGMLDTGAPYSIFYIDSIDLTYKRYYRAVNNTLAFVSGQNPVITVTGFTEPDIMVFDITDPFMQKSLDGVTLDGTEGNYRVSFISGSPGTRYLAVTAGSVMTAANVLADVPSDLQVKTNNADYIVITPPELKNAVQALSAYRQGQGHSTKVVDLEDIMDEFNYGIYDPEAIRTFLAYAYNNWQTAPRYVVLAGEGTYDYRNILGYGDNLVPTAMVNTPDGLFASDNYFADVNGDYLPEIAIGRLPVVTEEELQKILDKIIKNENLAAGTEKKVLMLADNPVPRNNFTKDSDDIAAFVSDDYAVEKIYLSEHAAGAGRQLVIDGISSGAEMVNYIGHGGLDRLADEGLLRTGDVVSLSNSERYPVLLALTCIVGQFAYPGYDSLSEALILKGDGGTAAVWSPTGLSLHTKATVLNREFFISAFDDGKEEKILGDMVLDALRESADSGGTFVFMHDIYTILGDPALRIP